MSDVVEICNTKNIKNYIYNIRWNMTYLCNYYCDFCIQGNKNNHIINSKGESKQLRKKICDKILKFIRTKLNNNYKELYIYLIGGEVTILPDFLDLLEDLVNVEFNGKVNIHITTNLSNSLDYYKKVAKIFKNKKDRRLILSCSYYKNYTTEREFIKKCIIFKKNLSNNNRRMSINYPLINDCDYKKYIIFKLKNFIHGVNIKYIVIRDYNDSISNKLKLKLYKKINKKIKKKIRVTFSDNTIKYYNRISDIYLANKFISKGCVCDSGRGFIIIDNLGNVSRCVSCKKESFLYNVLDKDIELLSDTMICPVNKCNCNYFGIIKKNIDK